MDVTNRKHLRLVVLLIVLFGFAFKMAVCFRPLGSLCVSPLIDDAFYSLGIARNIAAGKGITYDGYTQTDGFQPLYVFMMVPVYVVLENADEDVPVKTALMISAFVSVAAGLLVFSLIRSCFGVWPALIALIAWTFDPHAVRECLNGLETGLAAFFVIFVTFIYVRGFVRSVEPSWRYTLALGAAIGFGILTRLDIGLFAIGLGMDFLLRARKFSPRLKRRAVSMLALAALLSALIAGPWFIYVKSKFGHFMPTSGEAVRAISIIASSGEHIIKSRWQIAQEFTVADDLDTTSLPLWYYFESMEKALDASLDSSPFLWVLVDVPGVILLIIGLLWVGLRKKGCEQISNNIRSLRFLIFSYTLIFLSYSLYVFGHYSFNRYFFPYSGIISLLIVGIATAIIMDYVKEPRNRRIIAELFFMAFLAWASADGLMLIQRRMVSDYWAAAIWVKENTPQDATIGAFQSGIMGYLSHRKTINLDGVVNGAALSALKEKRIDLYAENEKIQYLVDWPIIIKKLFILRSSDPQSINKYKQVGTVGGFSIYETHKIDEPIPRKTGYLKY